MNLKCGNLEIIIGPMFSGKTSKLLNIITTRADILWNIEKKINVLLILYNKFERKVNKSFNGITTHFSGFKESSNRIEIKRTDLLKNINVEKYKIIGIDEGQFFSDLDIEVKKWIFNGKDVIISSLDGDYNLNKFGKVLNLVPLCIKISKEKAVCLYCLKNNIYKEASFTIRTSKEREQIQLGGMDKYLPVCLQCHREYTKKNY